MGVLHFTYIMTIYLTIALKPIATILRLVEAILSWGLSASEFATAGRSV